MQETNFFSVRLLTQRPGFSRRTFRLIKGRKASKLLPEQAARFIGDEKSPSKSEGKEESGQRVCQVRTGAQFVSGYKVSK
jgi:hypothetical protein